MSVLVGITTPGQPNIASTQWRTMADQRNRIYFFESAFSPYLFWVDLNKTDFSPGSGARKLNLTDQSVLVIDGKLVPGEVSDAFKPVTPFRLSAGWRPADMSRALSVDLRVRVLAAVASGLTHRQAGERFGVGAASVSRWRKLEREQGDPKPKALGGDRRSGRIEAHGATILGLLEETPDVTLEELRLRLAERGLVFGDGTVRRFLKRHAITRKKRRPTPPNRIARIS